MAMKRSETRKGRRNPPQKKILSGRGRTADSKIFIVALLLLVGIALLSSFFTSSALTGRAIQTLGGDAVDLILKDNVLRVQVNVSEVTARSIGALSFTLNGANTDGTFDSCDYTSRSLVPWEFPLTECSAARISYGVATLNPASFMSGSFDVVEFTFPHMGYGDIEFTLSDLQVWDTVAGGNVINLFAGADTFTEQFTRDVPVVVAVAAVEPVAGGGSSGGGGAAPSSSGNSIECIQDWQCADWTECRNGQQRRSCYDSKNCAQNTTTRIGYKIYPVILAGPDEPAEMKSCSKQDSSPSAQAAEPQSPALGMQSGSSQQPQPETSSFIEKYKMYFIALLLLLVVVLILIITVIHHRHKPTYNTEELKTWIKQERTVGTSDQDIIDIIKDKTGWKKDEVTAMFQELGGVR